MPEKPVGKVEHYYPKVQAAAVRLTKKVKVGDKVHIVGHGDDVKEEVTSLQLDHRPIQEGQPGQSVGLWVKDRVHEGDDVLLVTPDAAKPRSPKRASAAKAAKRKPAAGRSAKAAKRKPAKRSAKAAKRPSASKGRKAAKRGKAKAAKSKRAKPTRKAARKGARKRR